MSRVTLFVFIFFLSFNGFAQNSNLGNWLIYFGNKKINKKWNVHHEAQYRNYNAIGDLEQLLLRTGLGYNLSKDNNNILLGYGFINSQNYLNNTQTKNSFNEHRIFQQFITRQTFRRMNFQHRYRFEQRWIENQNFRLRFRYFLSLNLAINNPTLKDKTFYLSAYNEIFINNTGTLFDRNRIYGGLGYRLSKNARFEIGYMNQILNGANRDQINLITFITI